MAWRGWRTPVNLEVPLGGDSTNVPDFSELKSNPMGVYNLRRRSGAIQHEPGILCEFYFKSVGTNLDWKHL